MDGNEIGVVEYFSPLTVYHIDSKLNGYKYRNSIDSKVFRTRNISSNLWHHLSCPIMACKESLLQIQQIGSSCFLFENSSSNF